MKIGVVGYQGSGKSTLFNWVTGMEPDPALAHQGQSAMAQVPDPRIEQLCEIYQPKKITIASMEIVDTPGLDRKQEGNATRLALIREAGGLVVVVDGFSGSDPLADINSFEDDLMLADMQIMSGRIERLKESVKKPRPNRDQEIAELESLTPLLETLEGGTRLTEIEFTDEQYKVTRSFQLLTEKPRLVIINTADDEENPARFTELSTEEKQIIAVPVGLELELSRMSEEDREEFKQEMGLKSFDRDGLIRKIMQASNQMIFFTAGEKEVRTWMIRSGTTAVEAADNIHSDLARGFIRAETMTCNDLVRLGSEREVKAQSLVRLEPKDYIIQDDDIINIRHNA